MRVLITGGAGFIGSHIADTLIERGEEVTILDKSPQVHEKRASYINADLRNADDVRRAVRATETVIHAGGILGTHETVLAPVETTEVNVVGALNVIQAASEYGKNLINISKPNVWLNPYSITKDCIEKYCFMYVNEFDARIVVAKLFNIYGPRQKYSGVQKAIPTWIVSALSGWPVEVFGSGFATVDMLHTTDMCRAMVGLVENFEACRIKRRGEVAKDNYSAFPAYNEQVLEIGSGKEITVNEVVGALSKVLGIDLRVSHKQMRRGEIDRTRLCADISQLMRLTGFRPSISLEDGLRDTIEFYRKVLPDIVSPSVVPSSPDHESMAVGS